jgi:anthranilate phosphoribosyltransferase
VELGVRRAMVVHGGDGLDEITLTTTTHAAFVREGEVTEDTLDPRDFGMQYCRPEELAGGEPDENARITLAILSGEDRGPRRSVAVLNAAAAIHLSGAAPTIQQGCELAAESIDSGKAQATLERLTVLSHG